jgi:uncharacterized protein
MRIAELRERNCILLDCVTGSQAYGTAHAKSDTDLKGVYVTPRELYYSLEHPDQINEENNNVMFYELKKFIDLLAKNNPNMIELLAMPDDCIRFKHPLFDLLKPEMFLSKLCKDSFAGYAMSQIRKARGLNKKIVNPIAKEKKSILDFCYVVSGQGSLSVQDFLHANNLKQEQCGLAAISHMRDMYGLYTGMGGYAGIVRKTDSMDVSLSSIPEGEQPVAVMSFNKDGYTKYCKDYREYWEWVENRNEARFETTIEHGKNYDTKNMMHTFRLLDMAEEIGRSGKIEVRRRNREALLEIKSGKFSYEELVQRAESQLMRIDEIYSNSSLPESPDIFAINDLLVRIRMKFYKR